VNETLRELLQDWAVKDEQVKALQEDNQKARITIKELYRQLDEIRERSVTTARNPAPVSSTWSADQLLPDGFTVSLATQGDA
jgi:transposase